MKSCPTCQRVYTDEMSFCLDDGAQLVGSSPAAPDPGATLQIPAPRQTHQAPTEVYTSGEASPTQEPAQRFAVERQPHARASEPKRKSGALPWILGAVILGMAAVIVGLLMMRRGDDSQTATNSANQTANMTEEPGPVPALAELDPPPESPSKSPEDDERPSGTSNSQPSPTPSPKPSPSPRKTPEPVIADEPAPPTPPPTPTPAARPKGPISGGVLNGKALSLPRPAYPAIARAARAAGVVTVQVLIDESGKVTSARAVNGHPLLQQAAVQAAYGARFAPTLLSGQSVKVTGVLTYNFSSP